MNFPWAICLSREDVAALAALRLVASIEVAESDHLVWLRGKNADAALAPRLSALPALARYEWLTGNRLRPIQSRIPSEHLPDLAWKPIAAWLRVEAPAAALPAAARASASIRLVRSTDEAEPRVLLARMPEWSAFAAAAPQLRLERLQFAANAAGQVIVRGHPLPPLAGQRFVLHDTIAVPAGYTWQPAVGIDILKHCLGVPGEALALWHEDGTFTRLSSEQFVPATRAAVRATSQAFMETS